MTFFAPPTDLTFLPEIIQLAWSPNWEPTSRACSWTAGDFDAQRALVTMCICGGQGLAAVIEKA